MDHLVCSYVEVLRLVAAVVDDAAARDEGGVHVVRQSEGRGEAAEVRPRTRGRQDLAREEKRSDEDDGKEEGIRRSAAEAWNDRWFDFIPYLRNVNKC